MKTFYSCRFNVSNLYHFRLLLIARYVDQIVASDAALFSEGYCSTTMCGRSILIPAPTEDVTRDTKRCRQPPESSPNGLHRRVSRMIPVDSWIYFPTPTGTFSAASVEYELHAAISSIGLIEFWTIPDGRFERYRPTYLTHLLTPGPLRFRSTRKQIHWHQLFVLDCGLK